MCRVMGKQPIAPERRESGRVASGVGGTDPRSIATSDGQLIAPGQESPSSGAAVVANERGTGGVAPASASQPGGAAVGSSGDGQPVADSSAKCMGLMGKNVDDDDDRRDRKM